MVQFKNCCYLYCLAMHVHFKESLNPYVINTKISLADPNDAASEFEGLDPTTVLTQIITLTLLIGLFSFRWVPGFNLATVGLYPLDYV